MSKSGTSGTPSSPFPEVPVEHLSFPRAIAIDLSSQRHFPRDGLLFHRSSFCGCFKSKHDPTQGLKVVHPVN
jgi:hypothetical protein